MNRRKILLAALAAPLTFVHAGPQREAAARPPLWREIGRRNITANSQETVFRTPRTLPREIALTASGNGMWLYWIECRGAGGWIERHTVNLRIPTGQRSPSIMLERQPQSIHVHFVVHPVDGRTGEIALLGRFV